jgi:sortase (surface protein transpeptidase)
LAERPAGATRVPAAGTLTPPSSAAPADPVPVVTSPPGAAPTPPNPNAVPAPVSITIPAIGVDASVIPVGLIPGTDQINVPTWQLAGWYQPGPSPGDPGSAVVVGHVDYASHQGVFWRLRELQPGDTATIGYADRSVRIFRVVGRQELAKQSLPAQLFSRQGGPSLALITCGGPFDAATHHYLDNVVVVAVPAS